jgi:signal transduction histidine kinase/CheY-like chemotaxis protein
MLIERLKVRLRIVVLFLLLTCIAHASYAYKKIVVASFETSKEADVAFSKIEKELFGSKKIEELQQEHGFKLLTRPSGKYFIVTIEPFVDSSVLKSVLIDVREIKDDAFVNRFVSDTDLFEVEAPKREEASVETRVPEANVQAQEYATVVTNNMKDSAPVRVNIQIKSDDTPKIKEPELVQDEPKTAAPLERDRGFEAFFYALGALLILLLMGVTAALIKTRKRAASLQRQNEHLHSVMQHKDALFAKNIHELRTPIHGILGLTHLLGEMKLEETGTYSIEKISVAAQRMLQLVNDFLDFAKLEAQKLEIEHIEFDLNMVLEIVSDNVGIEATKKRLEFLYQVQKSLPKAYIGDPLRLSQVLLNLVSNAIKFTEEGGVYLKIKERERDDESIVLEFEIEDSGIGLSDAQQENLFKLFAQSDKSISRVYGGSGLGLAIAKELVELMGGEIGYKNALSGGGAVFTFTIRLQPADADEKRIYRLPSKEMMYKRALIVNGNDKAVAFLEHKLEYFHYDAVTLPSLANVLKGDIEFDLLMLDESQINKSTVGYLDAIRSSYNVKIILIETLYNKMRNNQLAFTFDYKLIKPFTQQRVMDMIMTLYGDKEAPVAKPFMERTLLKEQLMQLKPSKILLAEDNEINQKVILGLLKNTSVEVIVAHNGLEALENLKRHNDIALVLMDLSMPVMDGYSATKSIRKMPKYENIPIVALSANVMSQEIEKILHVGMQEYLPKPFEMDKFYQLLIRYLS